MTPFYFAIFISTTGQVYDLSHHFQSVDWVDGDNNEVRVLAKIHDFLGAEDYDYVGHLIGEVHKWQEFTIIYGPSEHAWDNRKARVVLDGVPISGEFEFAGEEWFGAYY